MQAVTLLKDIVIFSVILYLVEATYQRSVFAQYYPNSSWYPHPPQTAYGPPGGTGRQVLGYDDMAAFRTTNLQPYVRPKRIDVACTQGGLTVTVQMEQYFTGSICRIDSSRPCYKLISGEHTFQFYLYSPLVSGDCNARLENDILSAVLVMSINKVLLPHRMITAGDYVFRVCCNIRPFMPPSLTAEQQVDVSIPDWYPEEVVSRSTEPAEVSLRVLRNGKSVKKVLLGEELKLKVESNVDVSNMYLKLCNVSKASDIGNGSDSAVEIIRDGCVVMPNIFGALQRFSHGFESSFTAFQIDGSRGLRFSCEIAFCNATCPKSDCSWYDPNNVFNETVYGQRVKWKRFVVPAFRQLRSVFTVLSVEGQLLIEDTKVPYNATALHRSDADCNQRVILAGSVLLLVAIACFFGFVMVLYLRCLRSARQQQAVKTSSFQP